MSESTNIYETRDFFYDTEEKDSSGNPIIGVNRCGHMTSNDPNEDSTAKHASAHSVKLLKNQLDTLNSGFDNRVATVIQQKINNGEISTGGGSGSDVAVVGTPKIFGKYAIIGASTDFNVSSYAGIQGAHITSFKVALTGCAEQTINATDNAAKVSFTIPGTTAVGDELTLTAIAYDDNGNASRTASATIMATNAAVAAPVITAPVKGDTIVYNEGFAVQGTPFELMGIGSDTHAASRVIIYNHTTGRAVKTIDLPASTICQLTASDLQDLGHGYKYDISLTYQGTNLDWGIESLPVTVTLNSAIRPPAVIEPVSGGSFPYVAGLAVTAEPFTTDFLTDNLLKRVYELRDQFDNVLVTRESSSDARYDFGDLTGIVGVGAVRLYVRDVGVKFGASEWTGPIALTSLPTISISSVVSVPVQNATVDIRNGFAVILDDPAVAGGSDAVASCDFQICTGQDGSGILLSASESGQAHAFSGSESSAKLNVGSNYYARGRHCLKNNEKLGWGTALFLIGSGTTTPSGRLIYQMNSKNLGIEFDYFNSTRRLALPMALHRKRQDTQWAKTNTLVPNLFQFDGWAKVSADSKTYIYRKKDGNNIPQHVYGDTGTLNCRAEAVLGPVTDAQLNTWLKPLHDNETKTAKECTEIILDFFGEGNAPAAEYCRSLTDVMPGGYYLPLLHDLVVLYIESDYLDRLDPTAADYPDRALGKFGSNSYRWFNGGYVWSCQQCNATNVLYLNNTSRMSYNHKNGDYSVLPVREIN